MARESPEDLRLTLLSRKVILVHSDMLGRMKSKKCDRDTPEVVRPSPLRYSGWPKVS